MSRNPSDAVVKAWARLIRARDGLVAAVERDLKAAGLPPLAWYDVLLELSRAPDGRLRPSEIEKETLLAQYNLSRLLDRLEKEGLIRREPCEEDARGRWVVITEKGKTAQARTWKVYSRAIQQHLGEKLDEKGALTLSALLGRLVGKP
jgi:DNA-binding MarR family transcriptional regulator